MEQPSNIVDERIDDFIRVGRCRWDVGCFIIDRNPIYDIKGSSQAKGVEMSFSEDRPPCMYDSYVWKPSDDMVTNLFFPFDDDLSEHDIHSSFGTYPFKDANFSYEDSRPLYSVFEEY
jgi:hypothetical protein